MESFKHAMEIMIMAQEILVDTPGTRPRTIAKNSQTTGRWAWATRPGALLMASGLPYDSDAGRGYAAS